MPTYSQLEYSDKYVVFITGEHGGTGSSTTATAVAQELGIEKISGGRLLRGLAWKFRDFVAEQKASEDLAGIYYRFHDTCKEIFAREGNAGLLSFLSDVAQRPHDETVLYEFQTAINSYPLEDGQPATLWDCFVDTQILGDVLNSNGPVVLESKLAVLLPYIDEVVSVYAEHPALTMPMLHVLLTVDITVAAERISSREKPVTPEQILARQKRDFGRYAEMYSITGEPLSVRSLRQNATQSSDTHARLEIDTTTNDVPMVVQLILIELNRLLAKHQEPVHTSVV